MTFKFEQKHAEYGLDLRKDMAGIMTDGDSVVEKIGRLLPVSQQFCCIYDIWIWEANNSNKRLQD